MMTQSNAKQTKQQVLKNVQAGPAGGDIARCLFCGNPEQLIWVHGHGQCAHCGVNAMPCCDGASCEAD